MASDQIVWDIIDKQHCSFKTKTRDRTFCRNPYNLTGLCGRQTCPLANSRYATIRPSPTNPSQLSLYTKTIERAHLPSRLWEKTPLPPDYSKALELIDAQLAYWPKFTVHKCKQRLTRLTQVAIRMKRLAREERRLGERVVSRTAPKVKRREEGRERKAERAAKVERAIERELVDRLRSGAYGDRPLNVEEGVWEKVLKGLEEKGEAERDVDVEEEREEERELELEKEGVAEADVEYVSDIEGGSSEEEDGEDFADLEDWKGGESPDESSDEGASDDDDDDDASASDEGESGKENQDDEATKLRKAIAGLTKKRPAPSQPSRKPVTKKQKGPRREIEYELEMEPPARETEASYA
ncbi:MAG: hypothetical protein M1828_002627 [Chrysothrix sp. TS-e1954]|nr:MAG: hypothetical protein M1828_002627 [Chrysothrix sp. TS-e1954]